MKPQVAATNRLVSIDALRGFDMFWIMGGDLLARHVCGRLRDTSHSDTVFGRFARFVGELEPQFHHVEWDGFRFYDLIFPLFLFLVGVVLPFSLGKYGEGPSPGAYGRVFRRTFALIALGIIYNGFLQFTFASKGWSDVRLPGVLQRIGLCYFFAALIVMNFRPMVQALFIAAILGGYHAVMMYLPVG